MAGIIPYLLLVLILAGCWATALLARRHGLLGGLLIPAAGGLGWYIRAPRSTGMSPDPTVVIGNPDAAAARGFEVLLFWAPFVGLALAGALIGMLLRRRDEKRRLG